MLNSITKQKINNLRDLLVGKIPNPQGQVQQITLAMIYKFMSDIDDSTNAIFAGKTFFPGEFAQYKWTNLMDSKLSAQERLNLYADGLEKMNHNPNVPQLFRNIFKQAFLPFRDPQTLDRFLRQINELEYEHSEDLGDAYEYLLSSLSAAGDAGQFRTPRHIIDFIVKVVQPSLEDKILDPACGTAGFLISAYKYLTETYDDVDMSKISDQIVGYDISPEMVQLALVNLYLHHFPDPKIHEYDTLTSEERRAEKFDCILANPPFMTPKGGIQPHNKFSITSNRSEVLFVDYIMEHLRSNGKAGIIVPEGVIFQSANAYKQLRKMLIETGGLWGVISLPAGVFQPYSGVKTSILLIDKSITTDQIIFAKVTADGYDLGAQRREISKNDLPDLLSDLLVLKSQLKNNEAITEITNDLIWSVAKTELSDDYNLSAERYKTTSKVYDGQWEIVELEEICEFQNGYAFQSEKYSNEGYQVMRITNVQKGYIDAKDPKFYPTEEVEGKLNDFILSEGNLLISLTGNVGRIGILQHHHLPAVLNQRVAKINIKDSSILDSRYLFHLLNDEKFEGDCIDMSGGVAQKNLGTSSLRSYKIPLPPLEVQEEIVKELDGYQAIIDGARQIVANRKPKIEIDSEWEMVKLGEVCDLQNGYAFKSDDYLENATNVLNFRMSNIRPGGVIDIGYSKKYLPTDYANKFEDYILKDGDVVIAMTDMASDPKILAIPCTIYTQGYILLLNQRVGRFINIDSNIKELYLQLILNQDFIRNKLASLGGGGVQINLSKKDILSQKIPLPSLEIQQQIIEQIQHEQLLVDSAKELIQLYEQKVKERVERVREG